MTGGLDAKSPCRQEDLGCKVKFTSPNTHVSPLSLPLLLSSTGKMKEKNFKEVMRTTVPQPHNRPNLRRLMARAPADPTSKVTLWLGFCIQGLLSQSRGPTTGTSTCIHSGASPDSKKESANYGKVQLKGLGLGLTGWLPALFLCFGQHTCEASPGLSGPVPITQGHTPPIFQAQQSRVQTQSQTAGLEPQLCHLQAL